MVKTVMLRISEDLAKVIEDKEKEYNNACPYDRRVSRVEVTRLMADYLATIPAEKLVGKYETYKPNGNGYGVRLVGRFPGAGLSL